MKIKETNIIDRFKKFIKSINPNSFIRKIHISPIHNRGFPDLIVIINGVTLFIETKVPGNKPTPLQTVVLNEIEEAGGLSFILDCEKNNKNILNLRFVKTNQIVFQIDIKNLDSKNTFVQYLNSFNVKK